MSDIDDIRDQMIRNAHEIQRLEIEDLALDKVLNERWISCYDRWKVSGPHSPTEEKFIQEKLKSMTMAIEEVTNCHRQLNQDMKNLIDDAALLSPKPSKDHESLENLLMISRRLLVETFPKLHGTRDRQVQAVDQLQRAVDSIIKFD